MSAELSLTTSALGCHEILSMQMQFFSRGKIAMLKPETSDYIQGVLGILVEIDSKHIYSESCAEKRCQHMIQRSTILFFFFPHTIVTDIKQKLHGMIKFHNAFMLDKFLNVNNWTHLKATKTTVDKAIINVNKVTR